MPKFTDFALKKNTLTQEATRETSPTSAGSKTSTTLQRLQLSDSSWIKWKPLKEQEDSVRKLKQWILANVSAHYQTCCKGGQSLHQRFGNLKKAAGVSKEDTHGKKQMRGGCRNSKNQGTY
jgi:hypothetical protein